MRKWAKVYSGILVEEQPIMDDGERNLVEPRPGSTLIGSCVTTKIRSVLVPFTSFVLFSLAASQSVAIPITYTFSGAIGDGYTVQSSGSSPLANFFSPGDTYELTFSFDNEQPLTNENFNEGPPFSHLKNWLSGNTFTLSINGETFSVSAASENGNERRYSLARPDFDYLEGQVGDFTDNASLTPGAATSTLDAVDYISIRWWLLDEDGNVFGDNEPLFPSSVDFSDWERHYIRVRFNDFEGGGQNFQEGTIVEFYNDYSPVFSTPQISQNVPLPASFTLLGFGLFGLSARRL